MHYGIHFAPFQSHNASIRDILLSAINLITIIVKLVQLPWKYMKECGYSDNFSNLNQKVNVPKMTFDPTSVEDTCVTLPKDHFIQDP